jgi:alkanesulfonate monooxygenase SsuD/methylene tetrahydromethanopterin reductase-like flavin-dependent oxidoreductase (luciferase family)
MPARDIEFGLDSAACVSVDQSGRNLSGDVVVRNTVEEAVLPDSVGIDSFNIAEHYRPDFMDSAGHVILAAIAARTERIRLGTAVTVLSTQDPVRVGWEPPTMEKFRAEIAAGSVYVGSPQTVAAKLAAAIRLLGLSRFDLPTPSGVSPTSSGWRPSSSTDGESFPECGSSWQPT